MTQDNEFSEEINEEVETIENDEINDNNNDGHGIIKARDISEEMKDSFLDYAMSIIVARALPDVRDGLKPVHRRILYAMNDLGITADKPHKKSARIVGEVIGKYHPHGDTAVYESMVRMAQDFSYRYMLVDGHGNFGSIDRDGAAAMRYTEARMSKISMELMRDINKDTVDFDFNYDGEEREPTILPAKYPNLLANGSSGIAVGMATNIPSHNLTELINGLIAFSHNRSMDVSDLLEYIEGPDFATGAQIIGRSGIIKAYNTGNGSITIRSKYHIEEMNNGKKRVVVTEIPYLVNKELMVEKMADLVKDKKIEGVTDIVDVSNREGIGINIELRKDVQPEVIMNQFFRLSPLQTSFGINMIALVKGEPKRLTLPEILHYYLDHQINVITRRTKFELKRAEERGHILEGLKIALDFIDEIIKIIRSSTNDQESLDKFNEKYNLSEIQGKAILSMQLRRLSGLEREKIENEYDELIKQITYFKELLVDENKILDVVREELLDIQKRYGDKRRTEILDGDFEVEDEDLIPEKDIIVYMTNNGYVKRTTFDTFKTQRRGGRGIKGMNTYEDDTIDKIIPMSTHSDLLFFTNLGRVYKIRGHRIPELSRTSKGTPIINLIDLAENETVNTLIPVKEYIDTEFLVFVTKEGIFKRISVTHFANINKNGKIAINIKDEDELVSARKTTGNNSILIGASNGKIIRFDETKVRATGRTAAGVKGMNLDGARVIGMCTDQDGEFVLVVSEKGFGKMSPVDAYRKSNRGGKGVITLNVTEKNGQLVAMRTVNSDEDLAIINNNGVLIRIPLEQVSISGRNTKGVKLINLRDDESVINIAVLKKDETEDDILEEDIDQTE